MITEDAGEPTAPARSPEALGWNGLGGHAPDPHHRRGPTPSLGATLPRAALAFVHRLDPSDRNLVTFFHQVTGKRLGLRELIGPRTALTQQLRRRANCEVGGNDTVEVGPCDGKDTGTPGRMRGL